MLNVPTPFVCSPFTQTTPPPATAATAAAATAAAAAAAAFKGRLVDTDARWAVISQSVDDRTAAERQCPSGADAETDAEMAGGGVRPLQKSR